MTNPIVHFEIPADDVSRAKEFYEHAFGWKISDPWNMDYFFVETKAKGADGINGGLMQRKMPGQPFMNYLGVASIDAALVKVVLAGGSMAMPKAEIGPGMGWIAAFKDTEGNLMGLHEAAPQAASPASKKKRAKKKSTAKKSKAKSKSKSKSKSKTKAKTSAVKKKSKGKSKRKKK